MPFAVFVLLWLLIKRSMIETHPSLESSVSTVSTHCPLSTNSVWRTDNFAPPFSAILASVDAVKSFEYIDCWIVAVSWTFVLDWVYSKLLHFGLALKPKYLNNGWIAANPLITFEDMMALTEKSPNLLETRVFFVTVSLCIAKGRLCLLSYWFERTSATSLTLTMTSDETTPTDGWLSSLSSSSSKLRFWGTSAFACRFSKRCNISFYFYNGSNSNTVYRSIF